MNVDSICVQKPRCLQADEADQQEASYPVTFAGHLDTVSVSERATNFHGLYEKYAGDVYRFAHWLTGNAHDARDITSETFARVWSAPDEPRMDSVKAYLFAIARNLHRKQWRKASRLDELNEQFPDPVATPAEAAEQQDEMRAMWNAFQALPEMDRTLLLLRAEEELSYEDIAAATGLAVAVAKVRVFRARAKLAAFLKAHNGEQS